MICLYNGQNNLSAIWYKNWPHEYDSFFSRLFQLIPLLLFCKSYFSMGIQNSANEQNCYYKQSIEMTGKWKENFNIYFYSNTPHTLTLFGCGMCWVIISRFFGQKSTKYFKIFILFCTMNASLLASQVQYKDQMN